MRDGRVGVHAKGANVFPCFAAVVVRVLGTRGRVVVCGFLSPQHKVEGVDVVGWEEAVHPLLRGGEVSVWSGLRGVDHDIVLGAEAVGGC